MLDKNGLLPPGRHSVTVDVFERVFVREFTESATRSRLFMRWRRHREALQSVIPIHAQWIDGSYVTGKVNPRDIDVVTLVDAESYEALAPGLQQMVDSLTSGKETERIWKVDSYAVPVFPLGHRLRSETDKAIAYWDGFWQRVRDDDHAQKGYLEVTA